jgi:hypothetical protein
MKLYGSSSLPNTSQVKVEAVYLGMAERGSPPFPLTRMPTLTCYARIEALAAWCQSTPKM